MHLDRSEIRSNLKWKEKRGKGGKGEKHVPVGARSPDNKSVATTYITVPHDIF